MSGYMTLAYRAVAALDLQRFRDLGGQDRVTQDQRADLTVMAGLDCDRLTGDSLWHRTFGLAG